jgi:DNA-binding transcriptional ArsR family regulator
MNMPGIDPSAAATLRVLGHETRLRIVLLLLRGERAVSDIERALGLRQPNLSQQLGELRDAGLVLARREAKTAIYRLAGPAQERLIAALRVGFGIDDVPSAAAPSAAAPSALDPCARQARFGAVFARVASAR